MLIPSNPIMSTLKLTGRSSIPEMDHHVKRMLKLIEEDADSFTKKVEIYYEKRPELINLVEDVHRMYRSLAERYDHVTSELRKNIPSDLQSHCSGITDLGSDPPSALPSPGTSRRQSGHRAAGFDFFLGQNGGIGSEVYNREGYDSSPAESESESDDSSVNYYSEEQGLRRRIVDLEAELREVKEKFKIQEEGSRSCDEIAKDNHLVGLDPATELQDCINFSSGGELFDSNRNVLTLWGEHRLTKEKLLESEQEVAKLKQDLTIKQNMEDQLKTYRINLSERDREIKILTEENEKLRSETARFSELGLKHDLLLDERDDLDRELTSKDDQIDRMSRHIHQLLMEHVELIAGAEESRRAAEELRSKVRDLERDVEKKQQIIAQGADEKREAIRQLCFSLEHYRNGYHRLREVVGGGLNAAA